MRKYLPELALAAATAFLFFARLDCPLQEPEETRYAEIPRQMLVADSWLVPVFHGQPYYDKPPLLYWLVMLSYRLFGVHDWAARLVPTAAAAAGVLATYWWGRAAAGRRAALAAAFILCLSARYLYHGRMLTMNGLLSLTVVLAWGAAQRALGDRGFDSRWWFASAIACAVGVLAKGPVALALVVVPLFVPHLFVQRTIRPTFWLAYIGMVLAVASPWFIAVSLRDPAFLQYFFWTHHVVRYVAPLDHAQPVWYYLPGLLLGTMPWTLLLPGLIRELIRTRSSALSLWAFLWCLAFFSFSGCKRPSYILPALPPLALMLGGFVDRILPAASGLAAFWREPVLPFRTRLSWSQGAGLVFAALGVGVWLLLPAYAGKFSLRNQVAPFAGSTGEFSVICYPHRWDSVGYYLQRGDVVVVAPSDRGVLAAQLHSAGRTLAFVKSGQPLTEFLLQLPPSLDFQPFSAGPWVTVGWICPR